MITAISLNAALVVRVRLGAGRTSCDQNVRFIDSFATGKTINAFRTISALSSKKHQLILSLGGRIGDTIEEELRREGLNYFTVDAISENRRIVHVQKLPLFRHWDWKEVRCIRSEDLCAIVNVCVQRISRDDIVLVSGSLPVAPSIEEWVKFLRMLRKVTERIILDCPHFRPIIKAGFVPWIVKVNHREWNSASDGQAGKSKVALEAQSMIDELGVYAVIVTRGSRGAIAVNPEGRFVVRLREPRIGWTVGCGDAFAGGLCTAIEEGKTFVDALRLATLCSVASVSATLPGQLDLLALEAARPDVDVRKF